MRSNNFHKKTTIRLAAGLSCAPRGIPLRGLASNPRFSLILPRWHERAAQPFIKKDPPCGRSVLCPQGDSNPRFSLERAASWSPRRWGHERADFTTTPLPGQGKMDLICCFCGTNQPIGWTHCGSSCFGSLTSRLTG
jgi:hypothetical protein